MTAWVSTIFPDVYNQTILIERSANGHVLVDKLSENLAAVVPVAPVDSKINRAMAITPLLEAGRLYLPGAANSDGTGYDRTRTPTDTQDFVEEAARFPAGKHDDMVDAATQALLYRIVVARTSITNPAASGLRLPTQLSRPDRPTLSFVDLADDEHYRRLRGLKPRKDHYRFGL
jgi:hypothetical protein